MGSPGMSLSDAVSGGLPGMAKQFGALQKDTAENIKTEKSAAAAATSDITKSEADKAALIEKAKQPGGGLTPPKLEPPPQKKSTQPVEMWGSAAMWAAALGGLITRRPLINSLNAAGAVMNAFRAQDSEAAKAAFETWKVENDNAIKMFEFANSSLKDQLTEINQTENTRLNNYKIVAQALGDEQAARMQTFEQAMKLVDERQRHADEMAKAWPEIETKNAQLQSGLSVIKAGRELRAAQQSKDQQKIAVAAEALQAAQQDSAVLQSLGKGGAGGGSPLSDEDLKSMSEQYLAGDKSVLTGLGYGNSGAANRARLQDMIRKTAKGQGLTGGDIAAKMAEFQGITAGERTLGTTSARIGLGAAEMQTLVPLVREASKELPRTDYPTMNAFIQGAERETGNPKLRNLAVRLQGLKSAYSQVLTRGGVPTDSARAATDELFSTKDPQAVLDEVLDAIGQETAAIKAAPGIVRKDLRQSISGEKPDTSAGGAGWSIQKLP